jgi:hypothetical protein
MMRTRREIKKELESRIATVQVLWETRKEQKGDVGIELVKDEEERDIFLVHKYKRYKLSYSFPDQREGYPKGRPLNLPPTHTNKLNNKHKSKSLNINQNLST